MRWSIRFQLLLPLFLLLLGVVGISTWTGIASAQRAQRQIELDMRGVARTVLELGGERPPNPQVLRLMKHISGADFVVLDVRHPLPNDQPDGAVTTLPLLPTDLPPAELVVDDWQKLQLGTRIDVGGTPFLVSGLRLKDGFSTLYIMYPEQLWRDALWAAIEPALVLGLFGGLAAIIVAVAVSQRLARRIQALEQRTRLIAAGDFSPMRLPQRNDELRDLSQSVNQMAERLAQLQETVKQTERLRLLGQVGSGLAHQLRNGVTGARLAVQLHARACPALPPTAAQHGEGAVEALDVALRQLDLVEANLKRFLDLGRTEALRRESCDLAVLIGDVVTLLRPQCLHAHTTLRWQPTAGTCAIQGDPVQLGHLFLNLVTNAVEAAGNGGWVEIRLYRCASLASGGRKPPEYSIEVIDSGPGPPAAIADRLFQPFVTGKREGVGLGLAVARQVAEAHGGCVSWCRRDDATWFRIDLPAENTLNQAPDVGLE